MNYIINRLVKRFLLNLSHYKDKQEIYSYLEGIRSSFNKLVNKTELTKEQKKEIQDYYSKGLLNYYSFDLHSKYQNYNKLLSDILNRISDTFSALIGFKKKEIAQKAYNARIASLKEVHDIYITEHESLLKSIQKNIDEINKVKPILKDYILTKLSKKLNSMGITSTISDYPMETIDLRAFLLKKLIEK